MIDPRTERLAQPITIRGFVAKYRRTTIVPLLASDASDTQLPLRPLAGRFDVSIQNLGPDPMRYNEIQDAPYGTYLLQYGFAHENNGDTIILYGRSFGTSIAVIVEHA